MKKSFVSNIILLLLLNFLIKPFYILGIDAEIQNRVGAEEYGAFFSILNFSFLLTIFLDLGIVNFNTNTISKHPKLLSKFVSKIIGIRLLLAFFYSLLTIISGWLLEYNNVQIGWLALMVLNQIIAGFILYFRSNISGLMMFRVDSILSVLDRAILVVICSYLLWGVSSSFRIEWLIYAQMVAYIITMLVSLWMVMRKSGKLKMRFDMPFYVSIIKKSLPYATLILLMTIYYRSDSVMIERMLEDGKEQAGYYAMGYRFFEACNNVSYLFAALLLPMFSSMLKQKQSVNELVVTTTKIMYVGVFTLTFLCVFYAKDIIELRYHISNDQAIISFQLLMFCFVSISSTYVFGTLLTAGEHLKVLNKVAFVGMLTNILLNLILIPTYGAIGGAIASLVAQASTAIVQLVLALRKYQIHYDKNELFKLGMFSIILLGVGYTLAEINIDWKISFLAVLVLSLPLAIGLRVFRISNFVHLLKSKA